MVWRSPPPSGFRPLARSALYVCVLVIAQLMPPVVLAQPAARPAVAIVMESELATLAEQIGDELETMGFRAILTLKADTTLDELAALTRGAQAVAGACFSFETHSIRLWLFDRTTGKTLMRELKRPAAMDQVGLALHTVELLRASLLELELPDAPRGEIEASPALFEAARLPPAAQPSAPERPPQAPVGERRPAPHETARDPFLAVEAGAALVGAQGDFGPVPSLMLGLGWFVLPEWRLGAMAFLPLASARHESREGSSETRVMPLGLEGRWQLPRGMLRPFACLGVSLAYLRTRGKTESQAYEGHTDTALTFGGYGALGLGLRITEALRVGPRASVGVQQHYFTVDYADRQAARWGAWWWAGSLAFEGDFE